MMTVLEFQRARFEWISTHAGRYPSVALLGQDAFETLCHDGDPKALDLFFMAADGFKKTFEPWVVKLLNDFPYYVGVCGTLAVLFPPLKDDEIVFL